MSYREHWPEIGPRLIYKASYFCETMGHFWKVLSFSLLVLLGYCDMWAYSRMLPEINEQSRTGQNLFYNRLTAVLWLSLSAFGVGFIFLRLFLGIPGF